MIEIFATLAGLAFCLGVGFLFEVNYQTATRRGLGHFEEGDILTLTVDPEAGTTTTYLNGQPVSADKSGPLDSTWNPTVTKGYTCPDIGVEAALTTWRTRLSDAGYQELCEDTYGRERAAAREVLNTTRPQHPKPYGTD